MASNGGRPLHEVAPPPTNLPTTSYADILKPRPTQTAPNHQPLMFMNPLNDPDHVPVVQVEIKEPTLKNGRHFISWHRKEIIYSIYNRNLEWAIQGKFKYGVPKMEILRKIIPLQCGIKGEVFIGYLDPRQVLIRCTLKEDYIMLLSKPGFWLSFNNTSVHMRTLKWQPWNDPVKETPTSIAWISFPNLPPNFFGTEFVFSLALAVGKPLHVDLATEKGTRPSCAKVKVEVDLLSQLPQEIEVAEHDDNGVTTDSKWVKIRYDYLPKYCKTCFLQGHDEESCYVLHPELYPNKDNTEVQSRLTPTVEVQRKLKSGIVVSEYRKPNEWINAHSRRNRDASLQGQPQPTSKVQHEANDKPGKEGNKSNNKEGKNVFTVLAIDNEEGRVKRCNIQSKEDEVVRETHVSNVSDTSGNNQNDSGIDANKGDTSARQIGRKSGPIHDKVLLLENNMGEINECPVTPKDVGQTTNKKESTKAWVSRSFGKSGNQNNNLETRLSGENNILSEGLIVTTKEGIIEQLGNYPTCNTPSCGQKEETAFGSPTQGIQRKFNQNSGNNEMVDHLKTRNKVNTMETHYLGPVLPNNEGGPFSPNIISTNEAQNVSLDALIEVGPCVKDVTFACSTSQTTPSKADQVGPCALSNNAQNVKAHELLDMGQSVHECTAQEMNKASHSTSKNSPAQAKRDNVVEAVTQLNQACLENKTAITVPSQSDKLELEAERSVNDQICSKQSDEYEPQISYTSVYVSPSHGSNVTHGSNVLIPTQELELLFKLERLMKLHGTNQVTLDIAKELTKHEHQIYLQMLRNSGYVCTSGATGTDEQATPPKERPPQQPKRVQPARSSKSNSTRGK